MGKIARREDARKLIQHIQRAEPEVQDREREVAQICDTIERLVAVQRLNADYLISFGVQAEHRSELLTILEDVQINGELSLQESIDRATARGSITSQNN